MNDTEAEARRLLAAATEDMPPGTNLLDGFVAARQRDRRTRGRVMLSAGAAAAAALGTAVALTIGSTPPALATITSALTRTLTQSYHLTTQDGGYHIRNGRITGRYIDTTCTIKADPVRHLEEFSCSNLPVVREVGSYRYVRFVGPVRRPGKHWTRYPPACQDLSKIAINGFTGAPPQQMLSEIKKAGKVIVAGPASGPGWTGTRYAFSTATQWQRLSGTMDVDQQGRTRNLALTIRSGPASASVMTQTLTFSDFGARVTVTPPPADQTFSWPSC